MTHELFAILATLVICVAVVEGYIRWRIQNVANNIRAAHREADCSTCMYHAMKSDKKAEDIVKFIDRDS